MKQDQIYSEADLFCDFIFNEIVSVFPSAVFFDVL